MKNRILWVLIILLTTGSPFIRLFFDDNYRQDFFNNLIPSYLLIGIFIAGFLIIFPFAFGAFIQGKYKRKAIELYPAGEVYLCTREVAILHSGFNIYSIISADATGITLWKLKGSTFTPTYHGLWQDISFEKSNLTKRGGLVLQNKKDGATAHIVLYPIKSNIFTFPISKQPLDEIINRWQQHKPKIGLNLATTK